MRNSSRAIFTLVSEVILVYFGLYYYGNWLGKKNSRQFFNQ